MVLQGSQKFAVLLCKFSDTQNLEAQSADYYRAMIVERDTHGLNDYWAAVSLGNINLDGSEVFDWKVLEQTQADYIKTHPSRCDKIQGAIDAFSLDASQYKGVIAIFNVSPGDSAACGNGVLVGPDVSPTFLAHETGHVLQLEHSYDQSERKLISWSAPGEYYDMFDVMSAMNVYSFFHRRFNQSGPGLNAANLDRMGWLPDSRVWTLPHQNSSQSDTFDLVSLSCPEIPGLLAARIGNMYLEFRTPDNWDAGIPFAGVLVHEMSGVNSVIIASDLANNVNHWQPGQVIGSPDLEFVLKGGVRIEVNSFDLAAKKARLTVTQRSTRPMVVGPGRAIGGIAVGGGGWLILPGGGIVPVPPHSPLISIMHKMAIMAEGEQLLGSEASEIVTQAVLSDLMSSFQLVMQQRRR